MVVSARFIVVRCRVGTRLIVCTWSNSIGGESNQMRRILVAVLVALLVVFILTAVKAMPGSA